MKEITIIINNYEKKIIEIKPQPCHEKVKVIQLIFGNKVKSNLRDWVRQVKKLKHKPCKTQTVLDFNLTMDYFTTNIPVNKCTHDCNPWFKATDFL